MKSTLFKTAVAALAGLTLGTAAQATDLSSAAVYAANGHAYVFISDNLTWDAALAAAATYTYQGSTGYLATVTSAGEDAFLHNLNANIGWLSGTDRLVEGEWRWAAGDEAGQLLTYFNWNGGEPNNCCGGENYLQINWASDGRWNDHGGPGNAGQTNGFFVEFSPTVTGVPEPGSLALVAGALGALAWRRRHRG